MSGSNAGTLGEDILTGADEIAEFLFGDPKKRRRVYHLADGGQWPFFRMGQTLCARKSALKGYIEAQERGAPAVAVA